MNKKTILDDEDEKITCKDCGKEFVFTISEQVYFENLSFKAPKRCLECRKKKKARQRYAPVETCSGVDL